MSGKKFQKKRTKGREGRFALLDHAMLDSPAWISLSPRSCKLFLAIFRRHDGSNNGYIGFSRREAMKVLRCGPNTAQACFEELIEKGFLRKVSEAWFGKPDRFAREWRITSEGFKNEKPSRDFMDWSPPEKTNVGTEPVPLRYSGDTCEGQNEVRTSDTRYSDDTCEVPFWDALGYPDNTTYRLPCGHGIIGRVYVRTKRNQPPLNQSESKLAQVGAFAGMSE
ncbi:MAG: hypothetical protein RIM33_02765 [Alphaproteobacteria bacterium]